MGLIERAKQTWEQLMGRHPETQQPESVEQLRERILALLSGKFNLDFGGFVGTAYIPRKDLNPDNICHLTVIVMSQREITLAYKTLFDPSRNIAGSDRHQVERDILNRQVIIRPDGSMNFSFSIEFMMRWSRSTDNWEHRTSKRFSMEPIEDEVKQRRFLEDVENFLKIVPSSDIAVTPHSPENSNPGRIASGGDFCQNNNEEYKACKKLLKYPKASKRHFAKNREWQ